MNRELLNLQLGYGIFNPQSKPGQSNNVLIEMGGIFQNTKWTEDLQVKHKISILDQSVRMTQDLSSPALKLSRRREMVIRTILQRDRCSGSSVDKTVCFWPAHKLK